MNFKKFLATVLAVASIASFTTVSYAAVNETKDYYTFRTAVTPSEVDPAGSLTIEMYIDTADGAGISLGKNSNSTISYAIILPGEVFDLSEATEWYDESSNAYLTDIGGYSEVNYNNSFGNHYLTISESAGRKAFAIDDGEPVFTLDLKVKADATPGNYKAQIYNDNCGLIDASTNPLTQSTVANLLTSEGTFTVKGSAPEKDKTVTAGTSAAGATKITYGKDYTGSKALDGKYLVKADLGAVELDKNTTFTVTYDNTTKPFGASMWKDLGIENNGTLAASKFVIAVAFDFEVNPANVAIAIAE